MSYGETFQNTGFHPVSLSLWQLWQLHFCSHTLFCIFVCVILRFFPVLQCFSEIPSFMSNSRPKGLQAHLAPAEHLATRWTCAQKDLLGFQQLRLQEAAADVLSTLRHPNLLNKEGQTQICLINTCYSAAFTTDDTCWMSFSFAQKEQTEQKLRENNLPPTLPSSDFLLQQQLPSSQYSALQGIVRRGD